MKRRRLRVQHSSLFELSGMFCCQPCYWHRESSLLIFPRTHIGSGVPLMRVALKSLCTVRRVADVMLMACRCLASDYLTVVPLRLLHLQTFLGLCFQLQQLFNERKKIS
jgi:hypothetical protein